MFTSSTEDFDEFADRMDYQSTRKMIAAAKIAETPLTLRIQSSERGANHGM